MYSYLASYQVYKNDIYASRCVMYNPKTKMIKFSGPIPAFLYDASYIWGTEEQIKEQLQEKFPSKHVVIVNQ